MPKNNFVRVSETCVEIDGKARVERGPKLKEAVATAALLADDVTAPHYHAPRMQQAVNDAGEKVVDTAGKPVMVEVMARDAAGDPIQLDKPIRYLDWLGEYTWYVYQLAQEPVVDAKGVPVLTDGQPTLQDRWVEVETVDGEEDDAIAVALAYA